ncbi:MAG: Rpn family recombination-promoting nuclease/putative transposase [Candidatus Aminicenantes bacterium]|jgi:predicted transposase/invertase (TIGR01784 family)
MMTLKTDTETDKANDKVSSHNIHNNMFIKTFSDPENMKILLKMALPKALFQAIDFSEMNIDFTTYVSDDLKDYYSDIVVKTLMKTDDGEGESIPLDIYILVEHKTEAKNQSLVQILKYLYHEWQKDVDQNKLLRVIIPLVFYHGKEPWNVPRSFVDQFDVSDEIKEYLLNYRYILFDTKDWDFLVEENRELKDNVFLITSLVLMKGAYNEDMETVKAIFKLWHEKGFISNKDKVLFFLIYVAYIRDIPLEQLKKTLEESKIEGGDIMPSLAQRLIEQGMERGAKKNAKEIARQMLNDDFPIERIIKYTGLTEKEIKELLN